MRAAAPGGELAEVAARTVGAGAAHDGAGEVNGLAPEIGIAVGPEQRTARARAETEEEQHNGEEAHAASPEQAAYHAQVGEWERRRYLTLF